MPIYHTIRNKRQEDQQAVRNRQIAERDAMLTDAMLTSGGITIDLWQSSKIATAQLTLNSVLCQDDIDLLAEQLINITSYQKQLKILTRWYDWVEADIKAKDILEQQNGYPGNHLTVSLVVAKAELLRERLI